MSVKSDPQLLSLVHLHHPLFCNKVGEKLESRVTGVLLLVFKFDFGFLGSGSSLSSIWDLVLSSIWGLVLC